MGDAVGEVRRRSGGRQGAAVSDAVGKVRDAEVVEGREGAVDVAVGEVRVAA